MVNTVWSLRSNRKISKVTHDGPEGSFLFIHIPGKKNIDNVILIINVITIRKKNFYQVLYNNELGIIDDFTLQWSFEKVE